MLSDGTNIYLGDGEFFSSVARKNGDGGYHIEVDPVTLYKLDNGRLYQENMNL